MGPTRSKTGLGAPPAMLVMRDIEDLSTREAADALGITENAAKLRLHRARQALGTLIKQRLAAKGGRS